MRGKLRDKRTAGKKESYSREDMEHRRPYKRDSRTTLHVAESFDDDFELDLEIDEDENEDGDEDKHGRSQEQEHRNGGEGKLRPLPR